MNRLQSRRGRVARCVASTFYLTVLLSIAAGCKKSQTSTGITPQGTIIYDNRGGLAYAGLRVTLSGSNNYTINTYSDAVGDDKLAAQGTFEKAGSRYIFKHGDQQSIFHVVTVDGVEYLLDERRFAEFSRTNDREKLRSAMRRQD